MMNENNNTSAEDKVSELEAELEKVKATVTYLIKAIPLKYRKAFFEMGDDPYLPVKRTFKPSQFIADKSMYELHEIQIPENKEELTSAKDRMLLHAKKNEKDKVLRQAGFHTDINFARTIKRRNEEEF